MHTTLLCTLRFPELHLKTPDAHKLRGYFGNLFKERSPLLHNHFEEGGLRYAYPLVQYKVIRNMPMLVGLEEGAKLLVELFILFLKAFSITKRNKFIQCSSHGITPLFAHTRKLTHINRQSSGRDSK